MLLDRDFLFGENVLRRVIIYVLSFDVLFEALP
jgi:hypothetical protein